MRRRESAGEAAPEVLCRFVPDEWPGDAWEAFRAWKQARHAWVKDHPRSVLGDALDVIAAELAEHRRRFIFGAESMPPGHF